MLDFSVLFERLITVDIDGAREEFRAWPTSDDAIFARLIIWATGKTTLIRSADVGAIVKGLSDRAFWDSRHQRDLLLVLSGRWNDLDDESRLHIERRLLSGPERWEGEASDDFSERKAWYSLTRIHWLSTHKCKFSFDLAEASRALELKAPQWRKEYADKAAESLEGRSGFVRQNTDFASLLGAPLPSVLSSARKLSGRSDDFLIENAPFAGLSVGRPVRALSALTLSAKAGEFPVWAWQAFLNPDARKNDNKRFVRLLAERLASYSDQIIGTIIRPVSYWFISATKVLATEFPDSFDKLTQKLIEALRLQPIEGQSGVVRGSREPDWVTEALNAPSGKVSEALFFDARLTNLKVGKGFPTAWLRHVSGLLSLEGDPRRYAMIFFTRNLDWFYFLDPLWTDNKLISTMEGQDVQDREAAWAGFLWAAQVPREKLYARLKRGLLDLAKNPVTSRHDYGGIVASLILAGWGNVDKNANDRHVSIDEMRDLLLKVDDQFRSHILWELNRWMNYNDKETASQWRNRAIELLEEIWPRQISLKTPKISARLFDLAFSNEKCFERLGKAILPLLTKIDGTHLVMPSFRAAKDNIVDLHPRLVLALLNAVLPEDVALWPYGIGAVFTPLVEGDKSLSTDPVFVALKRRWEAR